MFLFRLKISPFTKTFGDSVQLFVVASFRVLQARVQNLQGAEIAVVRRVHSGDFWVFASLLRILWWSYAGSTAGYLKTCKPEILPVWRSSWFKTSSNCGFAHLGEENFSGGGRTQTCYLSEKCAQLPELQTSLGFLLVIRQSDVSTFLQSTLLFKVKEVIQLTAAGFPHSSALLTSPQS